MAVHTKTRDRRVFKFCHDTSKLKALQREITLFRFMRETLGGRDDITALLDWQFEQPPFFIESEFSATGNLLEWIQAQGGVAAVPYHDRIDIIRRAAVALSAAHSVGVLHKDVKPANLLVHRTVDGSLAVRLCDFGVSMLTERGRLNALGVTAAGFTNTDDTASSSDAGTRLYMAPEVIEGKPSTTGADVYALGVMLYQMAAGDLSKALAQGWERDVADEVVREDILAAVDGAPDRRASAAQIAERLETLSERQAVRATRAAKRRTRSTRGAGRPPAAELDHRGVVRSPGPWSWFGLCVRASGELRASGPDRSDAAQQRRDGTACHGGGWRQAGGGNPARQGGGRRSRASRHVRDDRGRASRLGTNARNSAATSRTSVGEGPGPGVHELGCV